MEHRWDGLDSLLSPRTYNKRQTTTFLGSPVIGGGVLGFGIWAGGWLGLELAGRRWIDTPFLSLLFFIMMTTMEIPILGSPLGICLSITLLEAFFAFRNGMDCLSSW